MKAPTTHRSSIFQILKQHFVGPKKIDLQVSAYGKLPIYKDFLRQGLAGQDAQAFRRWLDRGVSKCWAERDGYRESEISGHALMAAFPATGHQILGYLWGSHDHGGLRSFPFVLFVSLPVSKSPAPLSLLHALDQVVEQAQAMRRKLATMSSLDEYYPFIRTARMHIEMHSEKSLREQLDERQEPTIGDLGDIFYGEDDPADRWPHLIRHVQKAAKGSDPVSCRLPRTEALPAWELNALWCLMLQSARRSSRKPLQLFYSPGDATQGVTLLHRDLQYEDIFALHPEMPEYDTIHDLRRDVPGTRRPEPVSLETPPPSVEPDVAAAEDVEAEDTIKTDDSVEKGVEDPEATEAPDDESQDDTTDEAALELSEEHSEDDDSENEGVEDGNDAEEPQDDTSEGGAEGEEIVEDEGSNTSSMDENGAAGEADEPVPDDKAEESESKAPEGPEPNGVTPKDETNQDDPKEAEPKDAEDDTPSDQDDPKEAELKDAEDDIPSDEADPTSDDEAPVDNVVPTREPASQLAVPKFQSALGRAQRSQPPVALLDPEFWSA